MKVRPYFFFGLLFPFLAVAQGLPEQPSQIGYSSPDAALQALRSKPGVVITEEGQWIILADKSEYAVWSIAKPGNPAYPAAVKRYVANKKLVTKVLCEASKQACDSMVMQFMELNKKVTKAPQ
jgi:hypothetical protein